MTHYTREQLIECLTNEFAWDCHDTEEPPEVIKEFIEELHKMTGDELIKATDTDEEGGMPMEEYVETWEGNTSFRTDLLTNAT